MVLCEFLNQYFPLETKKETVLIYINNGQGRFSPTPTKPGTLNTMRILTVIYEFPPVGGGGGRVAESICAGLVKMGHEVAVLTAHHGNLPREEIVNGVHIWRIASFRRSPCHGDMLALGGYVFLAIPAGLKLIHSWKPNVIHTHFAVPSGAVAYCLSRLSGIPYLLTIHLGDVPGGIPEKTDYWFKWIFPFTVPIWRSASKVIAISEYTRKIALLHYKNLEIQVIPNSISLQNISWKEKQNEKSPCIVFAGRFAPQKNLVNWVRILSQLKDLQWTAVLIGDGPLRSEIESEISNNDLQKRISLPGWILPSEVDAIMNKSDILFMPSLSEGLSLVGLQALASGLAIVASEVGGFSQLVNNGVNGFLCPVDDENAFVTSLKMLLSSKVKLASFQRSSFALLENFDLTKAVAEYEKALEETVLSKDNKKQ
ncbi:MAG: glycosyltransferase family 4 protein [Bacteroidales bacterium]|nr:glycosyltransferase family 4 protein [Bacteroidales bacterium]